MNPTPQPPWWLPPLAGVIRLLPVGRYRAAHWLGARVTQTFVARLPGADALAHIDLHDAIACDAYLTGSYDLLETRLVRSLLSAGQVFVDVGANWGYYALLAARIVGPRGRVICCEPEPDLYAALVANLKRNGFDWAVARQVAAAATEGRLVLDRVERSGDNSGLSRLLAPGQTSAHAIEVATLPLDQLIEQEHVETVALMKIDIEGAEGLALEGLRGSLAKGLVHRLLLELHPAEMAQHGHSPEGIVRTLQQLGYRGWAIRLDDWTRRRARFQPTMPLRDMLEAVEPSTPLGTRSHVLWLAPGVELDR